MKVMATRDGVLYGCLKDCRFRLNILMFHCSSRWIKKQYLVVFEKEAGLKNITKKENMKKKKNCRKGEATCSLVSEIR